MNGTLTIDESGTVGVFKIASGVGTTLINLSSELKDKVDDFETTVTVIDLAVDRNNTIPDEIGILSYNR